MTPQHDAGPSLPVLGYNEPAGEPDVDGDAWDRAMAEDKLDDFWADRDVRRVVAQLPRGDGAPRLDDVDWDRFHHAYGPASDVPVLLARLNDPDPAAASEALGVLANNLRHQGGTSCAGPLAVPFLIRLAADPDVHHRWQLLDLAGEIGRRNHFGRDTRTGLLRCADDEERYDNHGYPEQWSIQAGRDALAADTAVLLSLLDYPDSHVREITDGLRHRLRSETEPPVRISLLLAIAQIAHEHQQQLDVTAAWVQSLWSDPVHPLDVRLGAGIAWLCLTDAPPPTPLLDLLGHAVTPQTASWMREVPWPDDIDYHGGLGTWLVRLLLNDTPGTDTALTLRLAASPHPQTRIAAIRAGYDILLWSRSATDEIVAAIAERLADPSHPVAVVAARYLGRVGTATTTVADQLAEALDHHHDEVRAWAAVGLAHCGDPRAVAPLARLLGQDRCPWPASKAWGADIRTPVRLLDAMRPYAAGLLPALIERLREGGDGWRPLARDLVRGVGCWGADGGPAALAVGTFLLHGPLDTATVVTALGRIGPVAAAVVPVLDSTAKSADDGAQAVLAWASWRITGERTASTVATLTRVARIPPHGAQALRLLADLGPAARSGVDTIRALLIDGDCWNRVEAAHSLWRVTGDLEDTLPVLLDAARRGDEPGRLSVDVTALQYLGEIGAPAAAATPVLEAVLRGDRRVGGTGDYESGFDEIGWDQHVQQVAAHALTCIQHPTTDGPATSAQEGSP